MGEEVGTFSRMIHDAVMKVLSGSIDLTDDVDKVNTKSKKIIYLCKTGHNKYIDLSM